jgi:hypothetical protein
MRQKEKTFFEIHFSFNSILHVTMYAAIAAAKVKSAAPLREVRGPCSALRRAPPLARVAAFEAHPGSGEALWIRRRIRRISRSERAMALLPLSTAVVHTRYSYSDHFETLKGFDKTTSKIHTNHSEFNTAFNTAAVHIDACVFAHFAPTLHSTMTSLRILHGILDKYIAGTVEGVDAEDKCKDWSHDQDSRYDGAL